MINKNYLISKTEHKIKLIETLGKKKLLDPFYTLELDKRNLEMLFLELQCPQLLQSDLLRTVCGKILLLGW